jgi:Dockerin type I domain
MPQSRFSICLGLLLTLSLSIHLSGSARAAVVWTGPTLSFTKTGANPSDVNDPANQDRMTTNVWLTRAGQGQGGMFNIAKESGYDFITDTSPADTLWATDLLPANEGKTIAATNWQQLTFAPWADAYGGRGFTLQGNITTHNAVVKLITDDIYLDLLFTGFNNTGFFTYERSTGVAPPSPNGDYNHNNVVDAADYVIWRRTLNQSASPPGSGADGNSNGTIDAADYTYWRARFGNAVGSGSGVAAIPEPAAIPLGLQLFAVVLCTLRWRSVKPDSGDQNKDVPGRN